jgi:hypothetical protein
MKPYDPVPETDIDSTSVLHLRPAPPLFWAAAGGYLDAVSALVDAEADAAEQLPHSSWRADDVARSRGHSAVADAIRDARHQQRHPERRVESSEAAARAGIEAEERALMRAAAFLFGNVNVAVDFRKGLAFAPTNVVVPVPALCTYEAVTRLVSAALGERVALSVRGLSLDVLRMDAEANVLAANLGVCAPLPAASPKAAAQLRMAQSTKASQTLLDERTWHIVVLRAVRMAPQNALEESNSEAPNVARPPPLQVSIHARPLGLDGASPGQLDSSIRSVSSPHSQLSTSANNGAAPSAATLRRQLDALKEEKRKIEGRPRSVNERQTVKPSLDRLIERLYTHAANRAATRQEEFATAVEDKYRRAKVGHRPRLRALEEDAEVDPVVERLYTQALEQRAAAIELAEETVLAERPGLRELELDEDFDVDASAARLSQPIVRRNSTADAAVGEEALKLSMEDQNAHVGRMYAAGIERKRAADERLTAKYSADATRPKAKVIGVERLKEMTNRLSQKASR